MEYRSDLQFVVSSDKKFEELHGTHEEITK
jgi:hypothetical protein